MRIFNTILRVILALLLIGPILGTFGIFPEPTADMYRSAEAFTFIQALFAAKYIMWIMAGVFAISILLIVQNRMALVALLILPITVNIVGFHLFLDDGLFATSALMGNILALINLYFLWQNRMVYKNLTVKNN